MGVQSCKEVTRARYFSDREEYTILDNYHLVIGEHNGRAVLSGLLPRPITRRELLDVIKRLEIVTEDMEYFEIADIVLGFEEEMQIVSEVQRLNVEGMLRDVAYHHERSSHDDARCNWKYIDDKLEIRATCGAGTNSATICLASDDSIVVYHSSDYGKCVDIARLGDWIIYLTRLSSAMQVGNAQDERKREFLRDARERAKFVSVESVLQLKMELEKVAH